MKQSSQILNFKIKHNSRKRIYLFMLFFKKNIKLNLLNNKLIIMKNKNYIK